MSACFCLRPDQRDYIRASGHGGCIAMEAKPPKRRKQAEYMTAPERFAEKSEFPSSTAGINHT